MPPVGPMRVVSYWRQSSAVRGEEWSLGATITIPALSSKCCSVTKIILKMTIGQVDSAHPPERLTRCDRAPFVAGFVLVGCE